MNQKELAQCLGITTRQIRNLRGDGLFANTEGGKGYALERCIQEYINYKVNSETGRGAMISKEQIQAKHEEVKRQISILKLRKLRRELHEAADVEAYLTDMLVRFRNRLSSLPPKLAMQVSGEKDINRIIQTIADGVNEAMEELSEYDPDEIDGTVGQASWDDDEDGDDDREEG